MTRYNNKTNRSASKVLEVLNILMSHFAHGLAPAELARAAGLSPSNITRYVATLEAQGFVERIPETGRIRPSVRYARQAVAILHSLDSAKLRLDEVKSRLGTQNI